MCIWWANDPVHLKQRDPDLSGYGCMESLILDAVFFFVLICMEGLGKEKERIASPELVAPIFIATLYFTAC